MEFYHLRLFKRNLRRCTLEGEALRFQMPFDEGSVMMKTIEIEFEKWEDRMDDESL
ncbi:hypothetical protein U1Q18_005038, partial [Sarracenia purpurea var. burkii]